MKDSQKSYTFYGRDVYVYTAAKLASGKITFEQVGKKINKEQLVRLKYKKAVISNNKVSGIIPVLDIKYGNVWTNINRELFDKLGGKLGDEYNVVIKYKNSVKYSKIIPYYHTFSDTKIGDPLIYLNSLDFISISLNKDNFAKKYNIQTGDNWIFEITKVI